jgi:hypothetical protein
VIGSIRERRRVPCPAGAACVFIERDLEVQHGNEQQVPLHVRVPIFGSLSLDKKVDVVMGRAARSGEAGYAMDVAWEPTVGPFPSFRGMLRIQPIDDDTCMLELEGKYVPPGGVAGALFDVLLGKRIARATLRNLVERLSRSVACEYQRRVRTAVI